MNRQQKRTLIREAAKKGISKEAVNAYITIQEAGKDGIFSKLKPQSTINEDDKVQINIEKVQKRQDFDKMSEGYRQFVLSSENKVFTAHVERGCLISLKENPDWLFWDGDLVKINEEVNDVTETSDDVEGVE